MNRYYKNCQGILVLLAGFAGFMLSGAAADLPCISAADGFQGFLGGKNAKSWVGKSGLVVTEMERDPQLKFRIPHFISASADRLVIKYRAQGTSCAPGELYYSDGTADFSDQRRWILDALQADGMWHEMTLSAGKACDAEIWKRAGLIREIRLDPVNGVGGKVEIAEIRFENSRRAPKATDVKADAKFLDAYGAPAWPQVESEIGRGTAATVRAIELRLLWFDVGVGWRSRHRQWRVRGFA